MRILWFAAFLVVSYFGLMQVFRLTTYHRYFLPALPLLVGYSALVAWALFALELHSFFVWHLLLSGAWLLLGALRIAQQGQVIVSAAAFESNEAISALARSASLTKRYYALSSCFYLGTFAVVYLALSNS